MIELCALSVITQRGRKVIEPTVSELNADEEEFLSGHTRTLRDYASGTGSRGRFRGDSTLEADFYSALSGDPAVFLAVAQRLVSQLAATMRSVNSKDGVVVLVVEKKDQDRVITLLKLEAEIDAARIQFDDDGSLHLEVLRDLLPSPGDLQKGLSWPDPRSNSDLITVDTNQQGTALYFQNAYRIEAAPTPSVAERALVDEITSLSGRHIAQAVAAVGRGGEADQVVERIREVVPAFQTEAPALGAGGSMAGTIRPTFVHQAKHTFKADDIELRVPLDQISKVETRQVGTQFVTSITTRTPLTPLES